MFILLCIYLVVAIPTLLWMYWASKRAPLIEEFDWERDHAPFKVPLPTPSWRERAARSKAGSAPAVTKPGPDLRSEH